MKRRHLITEYKHVLCIKAEDYCFSMYEGFVDLVGSRFDLCTTRNNDCKRARPFSHETHFCIFINGTNAQPLGGK